MRSAQAGRGRWVDIAAFLYPYLFYHLFILWMWTSWYRRPFAASALALIAALFLTELLVARLRARFEADGSVRTGRAIAGALFISLPAVLLVLLVYVAKNYWLIWFTSLFYIIYVVFMETNYLVLVAIVLASFAFGTACYLLARKRLRILFGLYIPWLLVVLPVLYKYVSGGFAETDLSAYPYIEQVVDPIRELGHHTVKSKLFTIPRAVYIEDDVIYTGYLSDRAPAPPATDPFYTGTAGSTASRYRTTTGRSFWTPRRWAS